MYLYKHVKKKDKELEKKKKSLSIIRSTLFEYVV